MPKGNNTIFFIPRGKLPSSKMVTYGRIVKKIRPYKVETHCFRLEVGGERLEFDGMTATKCAGLLTTKIVFNDTLSTPGARFFKFYIKDLYYGGLME